MKVWGSERNISRSAHLTPADEVLKRGPVRKETVSPRHLGGQCNSQLCQPWDHIYHITTNGPEDCIYIFMNRYICNNNKERKTISLRGMAWEMLEREEWREMMSLYFNFLKRMQNLGVWFSFQRQKHSTQYILRNTFKPIPVLLSAHFPKDQDVFFINCQWNILLKEHLKPYHPPILLEVSTIFSFNKRKSTKLQSS